MNSKCLARRQLEYTCTNSKVKEPCKSLSEFTTQTSNTGMCTGILNTRTQDMMMKKMEENFLSLASTHLTEYERGEERGAVYERNSVTVTGNGVYISMARSVATGNIRTVFDVMSIPNTTSRSLHSYK